MLGPIELSLPEMILICGFVIVAVPIVAPVVAGSWVARHAGGAVVAVGEAVGGVVEGIGSTVGGVVGGVLGGVGSVLGL